MVLKAVIIRPVKYKITKFKALEIIRQGQAEAARFCTQNYSREPGTVTQLLKDLQWDTLQTRRNIKRLSIIYKMEHNLIDIPLDQYI